MAALLPTPSSGRDPGSRQRPGQWQLPSLQQGFVSRSCLGAQGKGQLKERAVLGCLCPCSPSFLNASLPCSSLAFSSLFLFTSLYISHLFLALPPSYFFFLSLLLLLSSLLPLPLLFPILPCSSPCPNTLCHPCGVFWSWPQPDLAEVMDTC